MTREEIIAQYPQLKSFYDQVDAGKDYSFWGMGINTGVKFTYPKMYEAITNTYGSFESAPDTLIGLLQDKVGYNASTADYEKQLNFYKNNDAQYYKDAIAKDASVSGWNSAQIAYAGGNPTGLENPKLIEEAVDKGYLNIDEAKSIVEPAFSSNYAAGINQYNNDLTGGGGLINKTLGAITSNPITTLAFPLVAAAGLGAFSGAGAGATVGAESSLGTTLGTTAGTSAGTAGATDFLGSQALGSASTGAVGSGATGFGLSAGTASGGAAAGTGLSAGSLAGLEYLGGAGSLPVGTAGLTAEQIAQAELAGQIGSNASSGLGYLGGAESLPSGTAGITGVTATPTISIQDALRGANQLNNLLGQQPTPQGGMPKQQIRPTGAVDYSGILSLLEQKAKRPNILSLLG